MQRRILVASLVAAAACGGSSPQPVGPAPGSGTTAAGSAGSAAAAEPELALDPTIRHGVLANGLTYYVKANKRPEKRVMLWLAVDAGSALETDAQRGLAHMVEHLAFDGTKRFPKHDIQDFIERAGMRFGADLNAYTQFDETVFQLQVPTDDPATVSRGLDVLRDWSSDISFDPQATIDERKIIEEERRLRNSAQLRIAAQIFPVAFAGSPYPDRFPIGLHEVIAGATADQLKAFYAAWYHPENMAVFAVGDIDAADIEKAIQSKFGDVPRAPSGTPARPKLTIATSHAPRYVVARDKESTLVIGEITYQMPHRTERTVSDIKRALTEEVFERLLSERLAIIAKRAGAAWTNAAASFDSNVRPLDALALSAEIRPGKEKEALAGLATELARVRQHGFSDDEIKSATAALLQVAGEQVREADTRDSDVLVEQMVRHHLSGSALAGPQRELELAQQILPAITNADLMAIAAAAADKGRVVVLTAPLDATTPSEQAVNAVLATASEGKLGDWEAVDLSAPLLAAEPQTGKIASEKKLSQGVTLWTLSNGARVYVKPTPFKKDEIEVAAVSAGGFSAVSTTDYPQIHFAAGLVNVMGWGNYGAEELHKKLAGKKVSLEAYIDQEEEALTGACSPDDVEPMMQLVYAGFTAPRRDEGAFNRWKAEQKQTADTLAANVEVRFFVSAFDTIYQNNPRSPLPLPRPAEIDAIDLDKSLAQYKARFANAADFSFIIVGAVDPDKLRPFVEKYLASIPATKAKREVVGDVGLRVKTGKVEQTMKAGSEAKSMSLLLTVNDMSWTLTAEWDGKILQRVLDLELLALLREKLGGTYTVQVQAEAGRYPPPQSSIFVVFESAPDAAKKLQDEAWAKLDAIATTPISDDTLAKVREQLKKQHDTDLEDNGYWVRMLSRSARTGDDLDKLVAIDPLVARATKEQIQKTARAFVHKTNRTTLTLVPEN